MINKGSVSLTDDAWLRYFVRDSLYQFFDLNYGIIELPVTLVRLSQRNLSKWSYCLHVYLRFLISYFYKRHIRQSIIMSIFNHLNVNENHVSFEHNIIVIRNSILILSCKRKSQHHSFSLTLVCLYLIYMIYGHMHSSLVIIMSTYSVVIDP